MKFYILPTEEHPTNEQKEYALIREGTLKLFTGESYDKTPEDKRLSKDLSKEYEVLEFEVDDTLRTEPFKATLEGTQTYKSTPLDPNIITKPLTYTDKTHPQKLRFSKVNQTNIGIIKAYKKDKNTHTFLEDFTGLNNPHNEIYTIDLEQEIQLKAFIYEGQKTYVERVTNENTEIKRNHALQQGNITKTIITDKAKFNDIAEEEIKWAFKIVSESYHGKNATTGRLKKGTRDKGEAFPLIGKTIKYNKDLKQSFSEETKEYQDIKKIPFQTLQENHIELQERGLSIKVALKSLFDEKNLKGLVGKNIIFFAYGANEGIDKSTDSNQNVYCIYQDNGKRGQSKKVYKDRITSVELKIVESRFALEFDGQTLSLLENERILKEWEARSGMPIENFQEDSKENKERQRFCIPSQNNTSYYYDKISHTQATKETKDAKETQPLDEDTYFVKISHQNFMFANMIQDKSFLNIYDHNNNEVARINMKPLENHSSHISLLGDNGLSFFIFLAEHFFKNKSLGYNVRIPLKVQYQKRILIVIERFKQTSESTKARMNIYLDNKRVDSNGKLIGEQTKQYECYNPNNLPTTNPYAYILERPGPDSIGGELKLRVPSGRYGVEWYNKDDAPPFQKETLNLKNNFVNADRHILIHDGFSPKNSDGCLLIKPQEAKDKNSNIIENVLIDKEYKKPDFTDHIKNKFKSYLFGKNRNINIDEIMQHIEVRINNGL